MRSYSVGTAAWIFPGILWNSDGASSENEGGISNSTSTFLILNEYALEFQYNQHY
jgi:hypothetical protein